MINFIVCNSNIDILNGTKTVIDNEMMKNDMGYEISLFEEYDEKMLNSKIPNKIYILDIEASGIDIAKKIREKDYNSIILFLITKAGLNYEVIQNEFLFLLFINKFKDYEKKLSKAISVVLKKISANRIIKYIKNGIIYTIPLDDILYVTRDSVERKIIIKTEYLEIMISKKLKDIKNELGSNFVYSHRSCIVNKLKVRIINLKEHIIVFNNNERISLVSRIFKKRLLKNNE